MKVLVVADTLERGTTGNAIQDRDGVQPNQLSAWRRLAKQGKLARPFAPTVAQAFALLVVCDPAPTPPSRHGVPSREQIRIVIGKVKLELAAEMPSGYIATHPPLANHLGPSGEML